MQRRRAKVRLDNVTQTHSGGEAQIYLLPPALWTAFQRVTEALVSVVAASKKVYTAARPGVPWRRHTAARR